MGIMADKVLEFFQKGWKFVIGKPKRAIHGFKVGLALMLVTVLYYTRPLIADIGQAGNAMWAVITVVVVFEITVGGVIYKGFNRIAGTLLAGSIAIGIHSIAVKSGKKVEQGVFVFVIASAATFSRCIPTVKTRYDYGVTVFILTFCMICISNYRLEEIISMAEERLMTVIIGCIICLLVCMVVFPTYAGGDLHLLISDNIETLATSLEGCASAYFNDGVGEERKFHDDGYKSIINSKQSEDSLANLARWEPVHGRFRFRHPWKHYLLIGDSTRHCSYSIENINACIDYNLPSNAPPEIATMTRKLKKPCLDLTYECSKILKELSHSIKTMTRPCQVDLMLREMICAVECLQSSMRPLLLEKSFDIQIVASLPSTESVHLLNLFPLVSVVSSLIELSVRTKGLADAVAVLADEAGFWDLKLSQDLANQKIEIAI